METPISDFVGTIEQAISDLEHAMSEARRLDEEHTRYCHEQQTNIPEPFGLSVMAKILDGVTEQLRATLTPAIMAEATEEDRRFSHADDMADRNRY